jgi:hypothetical protein
MLNLEVYAMKVGFIAKDVKFMMYLNPSNAPNFEKWTTILQAN